MANDFWFKRKTYGWGWTPANRKGWLATVVHIIGSVAWPIVTIANGTFDIPTYLIFVTLWTLGLVGLCIWKGEKPEWQWGDKNPPKK